MKKLKKFWFFLRDQKTLAVLVVLGPAIVWLWHEMRPSKPHIDPPPSVVSAGNITTGNINQSGTTEGDNSGVTNAAPGAVVISKHGGDDSK